MSLCIGLTLGLAGPAWGGAKLTGRYIQPFLGRAHPEGYRNYAVLAPGQYRYQYDIDKHFDDFGNYLVEGFSVWYWEERRPGEGKGNNVREDGSFREVNARHLFFYGTYLSVQDRSRGWNVSLGISDYARAHLTSLTYSVPRYQGLRLDVSSQKNRGTFLLSRGWTQTRSDSDLLPGGSTIPYYNPSIPVHWRTTQSPTPFFALRWETDIGDAVTLGTTFVNQHHQDVTRKESVLTARGSLPYPMLPPEQVILHFFDDSPEDGVGGAAVIRRARARDRRRRQPADTVRTDDPGRSGGGGPPGGERERGGFVRLRHAAFALASGDGGGSGSGERLPDWREPDAQVLH